MSLCTLQVPNYDPSEYHTERLYARYAEDKLFKSVLCRSAFSETLSCCKCNLHVLAAAVFLVTGRS